MDPMNRHFSPINRLESVNGIQFSLCGIPTNLIFAHRVVCTILLYSSCFSVLSFLTFCAPCSATHPVPCWSLCICLWHVRLSYPYRLTWPTVRLAVGVGRSCEIPPLFSPVSAVGIQVSFWQCSQTTVFHYGAGNRWLGTS